MRSPRATKKGGNLWLISNGTIVINAQIGLFYETV